MKDDKGLYYHPTLQDTSVRMYVRENAGEIEFRLANVKEPAIWERHGWVPISAIKKAAELYRKERDPNRNPLGMYDESVARRLLDDAGRD